MPNIPVFNINGTDYKLKDTDLRNNIVLAQNTQPTNENNRIWLQADSEERQVPTWEEFSDVKSALWEGSNWVGYPLNILDARTFYISNSVNWELEKTKDSLQITHKTSYSTGYPRTPILELPVGEYVFHANYDNSANELTLYDGGSYVKSLSDGATFEVLESSQYYIMFYSTDVATYSITEIGLYKQFVGKIQEIESKIDDITNWATEEIMGIETEDRTILASGAISTAGSTNYRIVKYNITEEKNYLVTASSNFGSLGWAYYDAENNLVEKGSQAAMGSAFTVFKDVKTTAPIRAKFLIVEYNIGTTKAKCEEQVGVELKKKWEGKKWACVGDSLTENNIRTTKHYFDYVSEETGISVVNMGVSGSGYARLSESNKAFYQRISNCPSDSDVVTIFGSFNDLGANLPIGTANDTGVDTIAGCINTTISNLQTAIPLVNLGIVAPTPWHTTQPTDSGQAYEYVSILQKICECRSIPFLDLWHCSNLRPWDADFRAIAYSKDEGSGTHPDENGHKLIAPRFEWFLDSLLLH